MSDHQQGAEESVQKVSDQIAAVGPRRPNQLVVDPDDICLAGTSPDRLVGRRPWDDRLTLHADCN